MDFRTHLMRTVFSAATLFVTSGIYAMEQNAVATAKKEIAFSFDIDDVISGKEKVGVTDYLTLASRMIWSYPRISLALLPQNIAAMQEHAAELQKKMNGASNIVHGVIEYLKQQDYGDLSYYEQEIIERSQKPYPIPAMIAHIRALKAQGHTIVGATNQDGLQFQAYCKHMLNAHGLDLATLFDAVLTTNVAHKKPETDDGLPYYRLDTAPNIYVLRDNNHCKPHAGYFNALDMLVKSIASHTKTIVHTDDRADNIEGATNAGLAAIHFDLNGGPDATVRKTTPEQLEMTIHNWKNKLQTHAEILK